MGIHAALVMPTLTCMLGRLCLHCLRCCVAGTVALCS